MLIFVILHLIFFKKTIVFGPIYVVIAYCFRPFNGIKAMITNKLNLIKPLACMLLLCMACNIAIAKKYNNPTVFVNHFDYTGYTVTYMEDGVEKTVPITEPATTPAHMKALLKKVYVDPTIPGIHYGYNYNGTQYRKILYNTYGHTVQSSAIATYWIDNNDEVFPDPYENGMTMLLVEVNDTWKPSDHKNTHGDDYFRKAIRSIELMTNFVRVNDSINPGYLFAINDAANRFFFISKGKARDAKDKPFFRLFEQISPVNDTPMGQGQNTDNFISEMKAGNSYPCHHDCTNVFSMTTPNNDPKGTPHWFEISNTGEAFNLSNLSIFIPDRRFEHQLDAPNNSDNASTTNKAYNEYGNSQNAGEEILSQMPHVVLYTANLNASVRESDNPGYFTISLDWGSAFQGLETNIPEHFYVYQTDGVNRTLLTTIDTQPTMSRTHEFDVLQEVDPQDFYFVITAAPIIFNDDGTVYTDGNGNPVMTITADSPIRSVTVPGKSPFFSQAFNFRSRYDINQELNIYKNKLSISPTTRDDYASIKNNTDVYHLTRSDDAGNKVVVADVQFTPNAAGDAYDYTVAYNASSQVTEAGKLFDDEEPVLSGSFSGYDNATVYVIDRFTASTVTNSHPAQYTYSFEQDNIGDSFSNNLPVRVFKTNHVLEYAAFTEEEVEADTDRSLDGSYVAQMTFSAINEPLVNLSEYSIYSVNTSDVVTKVGKAENFNNSGNYYLLSTGADGKLNNDQGVEYVGYDGGELTLVTRDPTVTSSNGTLSNKYVAVIQTLYDPVTMEVNTYGSDMKSLTNARVTAVASNRIRTNPFNAQVGAEMISSMGYAVDVKITPVLNADIDNVYYYRVWRQNGTYTYLEAETLLNEKEELSGTNFSGFDYGTNYAPIKQYFPGNTAISFHDLYVDKALVDVSGSKQKDTYYIIRMYAKQREGGLSSAPTRLRSDDEPRNILIYDYPLSVRYTFAGTTVGIDEIEGDNEVQSVTYYNMMGVSSSRPFSGMNIVVTRYRSGRLATEKTIVK